jgi:circadian clock protein KaiC
MTNSDVDPPPRPAKAQPVAKRATGIRGFDEITGGGIPANRLTAIIGAAGAGKTVFALQTLINRLILHGEPGIFVTFEETIDGIHGNMASFAWPPDALTDDRLRFIDAKIPVDAVMSGAFDLAGFLGALSQIAAAMGARNIVFDGIDMLLSGLQDERLERQELTRLDAWIRQSGLSALVTVKRFGTGERDQQRADFIQYMTDCLVVLGGHVSATASSRTLRVAKYRGSGFAGNPVPVVIGPSGFEVLVFRDARLDHSEAAGRVTTGVARLNALLDGGYLRGSSTLISGSPGTSKTSLGASFVAAACLRSDKALFVSFDESGAQIVANMQSIGIMLGPYIESGRLVMASFLSSGHSPEEHFLAILSLIERHQPDCMVIDPMSSLLKGDFPFAELICGSLLDEIKARGITVLCTSLLEQATGSTELSASQVSTIADTWIHLSYVAREGERNRALTIVKARGTNHSNQVRELILTDAGINIVDVYVAEGEVLMGSARVQKEAESRRRDALAEIEAERQRLALERDLAELRARVTQATQELEWKEQEAQLQALSEKERLEMQRSATIQRLHLRRSEDDDRVVDIHSKPPNEPGPS